MRILFVVFHGFSEANGISKKIMSQIAALRSLGHEVRLLSYDDDGTGLWHRYVDGQPIACCGRKPWAGLRQRLCYGAVWRYCRREGIELVYVRSFMNASPPLILLFRRLKLAGVRSLYEVPTYPYDREREAFSRRDHVELWIDKHCRKALCRQMEAVVTFSDEPAIFGKRTIRISNGVDPDKIPIHTPIATDGRLHLLGVAEVHYWHGFDRFIAGLGEYYAGGGKRDIVFHIVGGVGPCEREGSRFAPGFASLIAKYGLQSRIVFHGQLYGPELDKVFNQCQGAIGSLARHRTGIARIKTLKNREYATRGLPFIYSELDSDFDDKPYILRVPADESPIDIEAVASFFCGHQWNAEDIRASVAHLTWKAQMAKVLDSL